MTEADEWPLLPVGHTARHIQRFRGAGPIVAIEISAWKIVLNQSIM